MHCRLVGLVNGIGGLRWCRRRENVVYMFNALKIRWVSSGRRVYFPVRGDRCACSPHAHTAHTAVFLLAVRLLFLHRLARPVRGFREHQRLPVTRSLAE